MRNQVFYTLHVQLVFLLLVFSSVSFSQQNTGVPVIPEGPFVVKMLNYGSEEEVPTYEKLEFGLELPNGLTKAIKNFTEGNAGNGSMLNPYLEWEIRVYAEFYPPDPNSDPITVDGFYMQEYTAWMRDPIHPGPKWATYLDQEYNALGGYKQQKTEFPFRVRFAAPIAGEWAVIVKVDVNGEKRFTSEKIPFKVKESQNHGYVTVGSSGRFLELDGQSFIPIGVNAKWPETNEMMDPEFSKLIGLATENYRPGYVLPRVYKKYKEFLSLMAKNGANCVRTIQFPTATEIEWEKAGDYTERLHMAQEMDAILDHCTKEGLLVQWNMAIHFTYKFAPYGVTQWDWTDDPNTPEDGTNVYGYKDAFGLVDPTDFFTNEEAKKYYKQRLRYILARWGYSTSISVFEIMSEVSNIANQNFGDDNDKFYEENWPIYRDWMVEMATYIKSHYFGVVHPLTGSYSGDKALDDNTYEAYFFDVMDFNYYDLHEPTFATFYTGNNTRKGKGGPKKYGINNVFLNDDCAKVKAEGINSYTCRGEGDQCVRNVKPLILSETDPIQTVCDTYGVELRRSMWQSLFSGLAGAISWELGRFPELYSDLKQMDQFINQFDLNKNSWHPGASELVDSIYWHYSPTFYESMDGESGGRQKKADAIYLRSGDGLYVIGVITNKTYNIYTTSDCYDAEWDANVARGGVTPPLTEMETVGTKKEGLKLKGLQRAKYRIDYYLVSDLNTPIHTSYDSGSKIDLDVSVPATKEGYIIVFVAQKVKAPRLNRKTASAPR